MLLLGIYVQFATGAAAVHSFTHSFARGEAICAEMGSCLAQEDPVNVIS